MTTGTLAALPVLAAEGIPYDTLGARLAVPLGILVFLGTPYLLLRSNLGTRRSYLVLGTSFFGFMVLLSLFWGFGAPGTPQATGPTNLPGQDQNRYRPTWVPFVETSAISEQDPYAELVGGDAFGEVPADQVENAQTGVEAVQAFFSDATGDYPQRISETAQVAEGPVWTVADNGRPVLRVTLADTYQLDAAGGLPEGVGEDQIGEIIPEGETGARFLTAYAFFDAGSPLFPSFVFIGISLAGFALHAALLYRDEQAEREELAESAPAQQRQRVPVGSGT